MVFSEVYNFIRNFIFANFGKTSENNFRSLKQSYPNGDFGREEVEAVLRYALVGRRRVKEQLKKIGGMEFYDVRFRSNG